MTRPTYPDTLRVEGRHKWLARAVYEGSKTQLCQTGRPGGWGGVSEFEEFDCEPRRVCAVEELGASRGGGGAAHDGEGRAYRADLPGLTGGGGSH